MQKRASQSGLHYFRIEPSMWCPNSNSVSVQQLGGGFCIHPSALMLCSSLTPVTSVGPSSDPSAMLQKQAEDFKAHTRWRSGFMLFNLPTDALSCTEPKVAVQLVLMHSKSCLDCTEQNIIYWATWSPHKCFELRCQPRCCLTLAFKLC